jgi:hypothetical protein
VRDDFKPAAVGVNADPSPSSSPLRKGRGDPSRWQARHFSNRRGEVIAEATARPAVAPYQFGVPSRYVIARSQVCRLEFRRRICALYLPAT